MTSPGMRASRKGSLFSAVFCALMLLSLANASGAQGRTRVVLLGTGTPNPDPDRSGPAVAVVVDSTAYLVDAGPGIVRRAAKAARDDSIRALTMPRLRIVFLTHLHSDHTLGLPDLMFSPWVIGRTVPLEVYGPPGTAQMVEHLNAAYKEDVEIRLHGGEPSNKTGYGGKSHEIMPGVVYRDSLVTVRAFAVPHGKWPLAFGYRFDTPDRSIVISGDTRASDAVVTACNGCDVLVHEVISDSALVPRTADWQAYHHAYHTTARELGELAARAKPKLLVLYHQLFASEDVLLAEIRSRYAGAVVSGKDLGIY